MFSLTEECQLINVNGVIDSRKDHQWRGSLGGRMSGARMAARGVRGCGNVMGVLTDKEDEKDQWGGGGGPAARETGHRAGIDK